MENTKSKNELEQRTLTFAVAGVRFVSTWHNNNVTSVLSRQLLRSATSVGANCREASRAESREPLAIVTTINRKAKGR